MPFNYIDMKWLIIRKMSQWFHVVPIGTSATRRSWHTFHCFDMIKCQGNDISEVMQGWLKVQVSITWARRNICITFVIEMINNLIEFDFFTRKRKEVTKLRKKKTVQPKEQVILLWKYIIIHFLFSTIMYVFCWK